METNYSQGLQAEIAPRPRTAPLLRTVHRIYNEQFRRWFGIMAPTAVSAGIILVLGDQRVKAIARGISRGAFASHFRDIVVMIAIRFGGFLLSWIFGAFALAAVATVVNELDVEDKTENWSRDSYHRAREHLGAIVAIAIVTFCLFLVGLAGIFFVQSAIFQIFGTRFLSYNGALGIIGCVVIGSTVGWLGASIPLVLKGDTKILAALKRSVELSNGYEGAVFLLVVESVAGSLLVWYLVVHGLPFLLPRVLTGSAWYGWVLNLVGVLASACVESPLFIGFALLADPERHQRMERG